MARVFITGSSDGLGLMAARLLIDQGHEIVLHGRNEGRSRDALAAAAGAEGVVSGDLSTITGAERSPDRGRRADAAPTSDGRTALRHASLNAGLKKARRRAFR